MSEKTEKKFICIKCPRGCEITTTLDGYSIESVTGNVCKLGAEYVKDEITNPRRTVTTTVRVKNGKHPVVPVWTESPIPKDRIFELMKLLDEIELEAPVKTDQIVLPNAFNLGINIIASCMVERK